ncbi:MAM and LDL-receptor class A domain-containing 2-like [Brachionus plicatilis]|uniref:MAM and LDL-receptor class A domain-containing 2-like n=1 Tax=Brachionus plicatilis TaxID=10195 RepID=A0A3M7RTS6_BRAPC|nr:MAM and LDL-receptor class A domain-containing 2-like [Brachionus plicatilis]
MMLNGDGCVLFWYHMYGKKMGTLNVYLISETNKDLLWTLSGEIGQSWNHGLAPFKSNVKYQIMFEGIVGSSFTGDIALDDLEIKYETCQVQPANALPQIQTSIFADCSFEDTLCFWQNEVTGTQFNWTLHSGSTGSVGTGPENGALSTQGYIYIETSYTSKNDLARLISPVISKPNVDGYCLTFYYHMFGVDINTLQFSLIRNNNFKNETTIFKKVGAQLDKWLIANVRLDSADINFDFKLAIDGIAGSGFRGDISVDEISLSIGQCPPSRICDFETDLCNWVSDTTADFNWARSSGSTNSSLTGPSFDHTTLSANGHYIYIETSYPQTTGQKARIISPTYPRSILGDCFKFWYHLFGDSIGTLNVYSRQNNALSRALWSRSGNFGNFWRYGHVTISSQVDFQVVLEGIVGRSFTGDIAVDDIEIETGPCPPEGFCDFEDGFCGFYNTKEGDNFDWLRGKGPIFSITGPTVDHTTQTQLGYYAYINPVPPQKFNDTAWLISEILFSPNSGCLNFFYNMNGLNIGELNVYRRVAESALEKIWNISGNLGNKWMLGQVTIPSNTKYFDVLFEATIGNGYLGNIALDDVEFVNGGTCEYYNSTTTQKPTTTEAKPFELKCDFENSFCDWSNDPSIGAQWRRQNGQNAKFGQAPLTDVTLQSSYGYYAYIDSNYDSQLSTAVLRSPVLNKAQDTCLEFWYQLNGPINSGLTVALRNANNRTELWKRFGNVADIWSHAYVRVPSNLTVNKWIEFEGDMANIYDGYVAIDEVKLIIGDCPATQFCDFETEDICGYQQDVSADFKWSRNKVNTVSVSTGPSFDHTYLTPVGHYMYIETSSPQKQGEKARLISPKVTKTPNGVCLKFWYHAYGATIGTLNVYTRKRDQLSSQPIWSISNNQGNQWRTTSVTISEFEDFETIRIKIEFLKSTLTLILLITTLHLVVFEGIVGSSYSGDIAIDDIFIDTRGACTKPVQCSFEESLCNWQEEPTNAFNLLRITGQQLAQLYPQTSIKVDTTLNSGYGHFLWMNPSYDMRVLNKTSRLFSQTVIANNYLNSSCFSFYYILNGQPIAGSLKIYRKIYSNQSLTPELILTPRVDPEWQRVLIPLTGDGINYEIYLESSFSDQPLDLAIDDVNLYDKKCSDITDDPFNPDPSTSFFCGDGTTITYANVCDFRFDCPNRRDEQVCGDCNFENSTCQYKDVSTDTLLWNRTKASLSLNGPSVDNTLKTPDGHYIQVDLNPDAYNGYGYASIRLGRILKPCSSKCELQLYYHMFGDSDDLSIYLYENGIYTVLEEYSGDFGDRWILARVQLGRIASPFQLEFDGIRFFDYDNHDLAIDDIRLVNCEYPVPRENGCPNDYFQCKSKGCVAMIERCDLIDDCGDMSDEINCTGYHQCDFENGLCDWQIDPESDIKWELISGETPSFATGASRDHTTGTSLGQYVYMETSGALKGSKARLLSSIFKSSQTCEIKIFYHAFGINIGALNVYSRTGFGNEKLLFSKDREVGNYWERAFIRINSADPFQLIIEGVVGDGPFGDLCIDDISFGPGCILDSNSTFSSASPMTTQTTSSKCPSGYFECRSNSVCLPDNKVCNFEADCDDKSDEAECGTCHFETSWCGFYDQSDDEVLWKRRQAPSQNAQGPQVDHTLISSSQKGSFLITELDPNAGVTWTRSVLLGPRFQATGAACRVSFWMFMDNSDSNALFFYTNYSNSYDYKRLGSIMGTGNKNWFNVNFAIGKMPANYQLEVVAYPEYVTDLDYYDIAIDDVEFLDCSPNSLITDEDLRCDFENGFCSYYNDVNSSIKWTRKANVSAYYQNTGPLYDHTTGVGYYAVYKPTYSNYRNDKGRLLSSIQTQSLNKDMCFTFWYLMFGLEVNTLNVYLDKFNNLISETGFDRELVWSKSGSRARRWYLGTRTVNSDKPWRVANLSKLFLEPNENEKKIEDFEQLKIKKG